MAANVSQNLDAFRTAAPASSRRPLSSPSFPSSSRPRFSPVEPPAPPSSPSRRRVSAPRRPSAPPLSPSGSQPEAQPQVLPAVPDANDGATRAALTDQALSAPQRARSDANGAADGAAGDVANGAASGTAEGVANGAAQRRAALPPAERPAESLASQRAVQSAVPSLRTFHYLAEPVRLADIVASGDNRGKTRSKEIATLHHSPPPVIMSLICLMGPEASTSRT